MHKDLEMQRINKVDLVHNFNFSEINKNCNLNIRVNSGSKISNDKVSLEGISLELEEVIIVKDSRGRESLNRNVYQTGILSEENLGDPLAYLDINRKSHNLKSKIGNSYYDDIEYKVFDENISFVKEYEEIMFIMEELNKYLLFEEKKPDKNKIIEKITKINELHLEPEYNELLKKTSSLYNSFITEETSLDKEERALEILAKPEFTEGLKSFVNNFNVKLSKEVVKEENTVRDIFSKKNEKFNNIIKNFDKLIDLREDYSNLKYTKGWQKRENNKSLKQIKKDFNDIKDIYKSLVEYQEKILKGTLTNEESKNYIKMVTELEEKLDNSIDSFVRLNGAFSFEEPLAIERDRARYKVKMGMSPRYLEMIDEQFKDYNKVFNRAKNLQGEFKNFIKDYKGIDPIKTAEQIRKEEAKMTEAVEKLEVVRKEYTESTAKSVESSAKAIERLVKNDDSIDDIRTLAKSIKTDIDNHTDYLYRVNAQSGTFELLRHITPAERLIIANIVQENDKGFNENLIFENHQKFIDSYLAYHKQYTDITKKTNFNKNYKDYILFTDTKSSLKDMDDSLKHLFQRQIFEKTVEENPSLLVSYEKSKEALNSFLELDSKMDKEIRELIKNNVIFEQFIVEDENGQRTISTAAIDKANLSLEDKYSLKELLKLADSRELNVLRVMEIFNDIKGFDVFEDIKTLEAYRDEKQAKADEYLHIIDDLQAQFNSLELDSQAKAEISSVFNPVQEDKDLTEGKLSKVEKGELRDIRRMEYNLSFVNNLFMENLSSVNSERFDSMFNNDFFKKYLPKDASFDDLKKDLKTFFEFKNNLDKALESDGLEKLDSARITKALEFIEKDCLTWRNDALSLEGNTSVDIFKRKELLGVSRNLELVIDKLESINSLSDREKRDFLRNADYNLKIEFYDKYIYDKEALDSKINLLAESNASSEGEVLEKEAKVQLFNEALDNVRFKRQNLFSESDTIKKSEIDVNKIYKEYITGACLSEINKASVSTVQTLNYIESPKDEKIIKGEVEKLYKLLQSKNVDVDGLGMVINTLYSEDGLNQFRYYMKEQGILTTENVKKLEMEPMSRFIEICQNSGDEELKAKLEKLDSYAIEGGHFDKLDYSKFNIEVLKKSLEGLSEQDKKEVFVAYEKFVAFIEDRGYSVPLLRNTIDDFSNDKGFVVATNKEDSYILNFVDENGFIEKYNINFSKDGQVSHLELDTKEGHTIVGLIQKLKQNPDFGSDELKEYLQSNLAYPEVCTEEEMNKFIEKFNSIISKNVESEVSCDIQVKESFETQIMDTLKDYKSQDRVLVNFRLLKDKYIPLNGEIIENIQAGKSEESIQIYVNQLKDEMGLKDLSIDDLKKLSETFNNLEKEADKKTDLEGSINVFQNEKTKLMVDEASKKINENIKDSLEEPEINKVQTIKEVSDELQTFIREDIEKIHGEFEKGNLEVQEYFNLITKMSSVSKLTEDLENNPENLDKLKVLLTDKESFYEAIISSDNNLNTQQLLDNAYEQYSSQKDELAEDNIHQEIESIRMIKQSIGTIREDFSDEQILKVQNDISSYLLNIEEDRFKAVVDRLDKENLNESYEELVNKALTDVKYVKDIQETIQLIKLAKDEEKSEYLESFKTELTKLEEQDSESYEFVINTLNEQLEESEKELLNDSIKEIEEEKVQEKTFDILESVENLIKKGENFELNVNGGTISREDDKLMIQVGETQNFFEIDKEGNITKLNEDELENNNDDSINL